MKKLLSHFDTLLLILAIGIFAAALGYLAVGWFFWFGEVRVLYHFSLWAYQHSEVGYFGFLGAWITLVVGTVVLSLLKRHLNNRKKNRLALVVILMCCANILVCIGSLRIGLATFLTSIIHVSSAQTDSQNYHLLLHDSDPEGYNARYDLYECDRFDLLCREIYSVRASAIGFRPETQIDLIPVDGGDSVALEVNNQIVFRR